MKIVETGVLENSFLNFHSPSKFAQTALYFCPQYGHFFCNKDYHIKRNYLELYLIFYIKEGTLEVSNKQMNVTAPQGSVVLIDCYSPHEYYCKDYVEFYWIHFTGCSSKEYCRNLLEHNGILYSGTQIEALEHSFTNIVYSNFESIANEHIISSTIHHLLANLAVPKSNIYSSEQPISPAIKYIHQNFQDHITVELLAGLCHMSVYHFIRTFKRYLNATPHEYLLLFRLKQAKHMLQNSTLSVEEIAIECGFNSASHFARAFKAMNQITPTRFRSIQF